MINNYKKQNVLGYAGLALLRSWLIGDEKTIDSLFKEISKIDKELPDKLKASTGGKPKEYKVISGYKIWSKSYDNGDNILIDIEEPVVKKELKKLPKGAVLDAGCGTGRYSVFLDSLGHDVTGLDVSQDMINLARKKAKKLNYVRGDINKLTFKDKAFDLVVSGLAIHYVKNLEKTMKELSRVLKTGGTMVISTIHPCMIALGAHAEFHDKNSGWGFIKESIFWHSSYIDAFNKSSLKISKCYEPKIGLKEIKMLKQWSELSIETMSTALKDLPVAIVWVLKKE